MQTAIRKLREMLVNSTFPMCLFEGPDHVYTLVNKAYYQLIGRNGVMNRPAHEVFTEITRQGMIDILDNVYATGLTYHGKEVPFVISKNGRSRQLYLNITYQPLKKRNGRVYGIFAQYSDVTRQVELRKDKEILLEELHHCIRTNLAVIMTLVELQMPEVNEDENLLQLLNTRERIHSFSEVHGLIYEQENLRFIPIHKLFRKLINRRSISSDPDPFIVNMDFEELFLNINQALPLGLICNEILSLVRKSMDHECNYSVNILSDLTQFPEVRLFITVDSNGSGDCVNRLQLYDTSFEARLIRVLALQMNADLEFGHSGNSTTFFIGFTKEKTQGINSGNFM